jgi:hypothetical protein
LEGGDGRETSDEEQSALSLGSIASSNNTTNQTGKILPQGKFKGKELPYKMQLEEQQERDQEQEKKQEQKRNKKDSYLLQRTRVLTLHPESMPNISTTMFFTMIPFHIIPDDFDALTAGVKNILTSLSNKCMPILTSTDKLNVEVASWDHPSCNVTTSVSSLSLEGNVGMTVFPWKIAHSRRLLLTI